MSTSAHTRTAPTVELRAADLPAHCPNPQMSAWNSHPRVFIKLNHGIGTCPYCGTVYTLKAGEVDSSH